jgi:hypothetical protein
MQVEVAGWNKITQLQNMHNEKLYNDGHLCTLLINFRELATLYVSTKSLQDQLHNRKTVYSKFSGKGYVEW